MTTQEELGQRGYQYKHGDRPLDGFTIERAAGRGGFGEVYFSHSDSGREVALKVVNTYEQIELRGISQCMNLKNPHLVTIFDVKYGSDGRPWVIMEYVAGPSLREILDAAPSGLGTAKAAFFLREVAKGLTYLHDCGIVHRDLKPGNIFYENGCVKIGDYGLSKAMSMTRHSGQTVAVGTLHYMAPEIGEGKYDRSIDIYAMGALLYEMLTGQVPFLGSSPAEVLMKHLRAEVNLEGLEEPFKSVIRKAMAKNPDDRYRSVQEMVEAVFGSDAVRDSVSQFSPATLSMMAGQAARNIGDDAPGAQPFPITDDIASLKERLRMGRKRVKQALKMEKQGRWRRDDIALAPDHLNWAVRAMMAVGVALLTAIVADSIRQAQGVGIFFAIMGATVGATIAWYAIGRTIEQESRWVRQLALGTPVALAAWPFCYAVSRHHSETVVFACCATLLLICWNRRLSPWRRERVSVGDTITAALCGFVVSMLFSISAFPTIAVAVGASLAVSLFSPWGKAIAVGSAPPPPPRVNNIPPNAPAPGTPPPIPGAGGFTPPRATNPFQQVFPRSGGPFPAWAIVAIVLGTLGILSAGRGHVPWFLYPAIIAIVFTMVPRMGRYSRTNTPAAPGSGVGGMASGSSIGQVAASAAHGVVSTIGAIFLIASVLLAVALVADVPGLLQSSLVRPEVSQKIEQVLGADWPRLLREFALAGCIACGWIALLLTLLGRRRGGAMHMFRGILGVGILFAAIASLNQGLPPWSAVTPRENTPGAIVDAYMQHIDADHAIWAGVVYLVGWVLLVWPARRREASVIYQNVAPTTDSAEGKAT